MANIQKFEENLNIISALDDKPSLDSADLKKKFDEGPNKIKDYLNNTLLPSIEGGLVTISNDFNGGTNKCASAELAKKLNVEKQKKINYGTVVPELAEGEIFIQIFD